MISVVEHFNWVDYTILGVVAFSTLISFFRGFMREAISLAAWVLGLLVSLKYAIILQVYLAPWVTSESIRYFITFVVLFLVIVLSGLIINIFVHILLNKSGMSITDRFIGLFFGAARGIAIVAIMLLMLTHFGTFTESLALSQSKVATRFKPIVTWLNGFLPDKIKAATEWVQNDFRLQREIE